MDMSAYFFQETNSILPAMSKGRALHFDIGPHIHILWGNERFDFSLPYGPQYTGSHTPWPGCMQHSSKMLVGACQNSVNKPESQGRPAPNSSSTTATSNVCCNHENYCSWRPHESTRFFIETLLTILFLFCKIIS